MIRRTTRRAAKAGARRNDRGSVMPVVLALAIGVGALASGFTAQNLREHQRERWERNRQQAYLDAWSQMETVVSIINSSPYDASQNNLAIVAALANDGEFVDRDGYGTGVTVAPEGADTGYFTLVSEASIEDATARVSALVRERQSFADFNWFVDQHDLGFAGGTSVADAPRGSIHTNRTLRFYFADRHFADAVTASEGFAHTAGATADNTHFHGLFSSAAEPVTGLTDIEPLDFASRPDTLLALTDADDWAKVALRGDTVHVEHWKEGRWETQMVPQQVAVYRTETIQQEQYEPVQTIVSYDVPVYDTHWEWQTVSVPEYVLVTPGWTESVTQQVQVPVSVWVPDTGGGGGDGGDGAVGGGGTSGHWETHYETQTVTTDVWHPPVYDTVYHDEQQYVAVTVQVGTQTQTYQTTSYQPYTPPRFTPVDVQVFDRYDTVMTPYQVWIPPYMVGTHDVASNGTIYVDGRVELSPVAGEGDVTNGHWLDGSLTIASGDDIVVQDSIVYARPDASNVMQTRYENGSDPTAPYQQNPAYTGSAVLGLVAASDVIVDGNMPDRAEINAAMLAKSGEVRIDGVAVQYDGTIVESGTGFLKPSLRRLGAVISARRPCTAYVNSSNVVTRGFRAGRSVYDLRMRTNPPRGFPTLSRPRVLAEVVTGREVN